LNKKALITTSIIAATLLISIFPVHATLTDNGDGTITDGNGLMWLQSPYGEPGVRMTWADAVAWADALVFAGYDDWRLPSAANALTGLPSEMVAYGSSQAANYEFPYLYMAEWGNPWGSAGGYSLPPDMELMPDYWEYQYPLDWWLAEEYDDDEAYTFWLSWDGVCAQNVELKTLECYVTAVRDGTVEPPEIPTADANGPYSEIIGNAMQFDGTGSSDSDGTIISYEWDFGDGSTGTGATPMHTYSALGTYTVTLTVTDDDGLTDTDETTATVRPIENVIPEVPFGTIMIVAAMGLALVGYVTLTKKRKS